LFVRIFGYAAQPITDRLEKKGGELVVPAEGFYVADTEGPLLEGELERAAEWAKEIVRSTT
jgi:flavodoxin I